MFEEPPSWKNPIFVLRTRKSKNRLHLRYLIPKIEEHLSLFVLRPRRSRNSLSSFFGVTGLRAPTHGLSADGFPIFFLYFSELVYSFKIPISEFYVTCQSDCQPYPSGIASIYFSFTSFLFSLTSSSSTPSS